MNGLVSSWPLPMFPEALSLEESCRETYAYLESLWIPSLLRKESLLDGFLCYKFIVDTERQMCVALLAYLNGAVHIPNYRIIYLHSKDMNIFSLTKKDSF